MLVRGERQGTTRESKLDPYKEYVLKRMEAGVLNAVRLLREIQERGCRGEITILRDFMRPYRPPLVGKATCRFIGDLYEPPGEDAPVKGKRKLRRRKSTPATRGGGAV